MKKSLLSVIGFAAIALCFSSFASANVVTPDGFTSTGFSEVAQKATPTISLVAAVAVDQSSPAILESKPVTLVHRMPSAGERAIVVGALHAVKLNGTYADREAKGRGYSENVSI